MRRTGASSEFDRSGRCSTPPRLDVGVDSRRRPGPGSVRGQRILSLRQRVDACGQILPQAGEPIAVKTGRHLPFDPGNLPGRAFEQCLPFLCKPERQCPPLRSALRTFGQPSIDDAAKKRAHRLARDECAARHSQAARLSQRDEPPCARGALRRRLHQTREQRRAPVRKGRPAFIAFGCGAWHTPAHRRPKHKQAVRKTGAQNRP